MEIKDYLYLMLYFSSLLILSPLLGSYMAKALSGQKVFLSPILKPIENLIYKTCFIDPDEEMHAKKYAKDLLCFNLLGFLLLLFLQFYQEFLPLNPQKFSFVPLALAINTSMSFVTNTNWQAYAGESSLSYLVQCLGLTVQNFLSAAVGLSVLLAFIRGLTRKECSSIGNFWTDLTRSTLYVLLPLSFILAIFLISQGVVQNFSSYVDTKTLEGEKQIVPMGPAASQIAIKQLGTNGGGFFGQNSAHPFENPSPLSNFFQCLALLLIPSASVFCFGIMAKESKHAFLIFLLMLGIFIAILSISLYAEYEPNLSLQSNDALEGKELRFGKTASVLWSSATTASSNGSVNAMHDSLSPLSGGLALFLILLGEIIFGGVGSGLYGMLLFAILTVFLLGLMCGRTPQYLGKKIEAFDIQMTILGIILPSAVVLIGAGLFCVIPLALKSLTNFGPHGLSEILYAWSSAANNNGSAFAGLNANTNLYNLSLALAMFLGRFGVILPVLAISGNLASKKKAPNSQAGFSTDTLTFAILLFSIIVIIGALTFFACFILGPVAEHFLMLDKRIF